jgi:hypothetical protein
MTLTAITNAHAYDWSTWLLGIFRSFLSGGAGALVALGGSTVLKLSLKETLLLTGSQFVIMGLYRMGEFLQLHGAPDKLQVALDTAQAATKEAAGAIKDAKAATLETKP